MYYVIKDAGSHPNLYFAYMNENVLLCEWSTDLNKAIKFNSVSDAASICGKMRFDKVEIVRVETGQPILTIL